MKQKDILIIILLILLVISGVFNYISYTSKSQKLATNEAEIKDSTIFKSDSGYLQESPITTSGYKYAVYLIGLQHSTCVPSSGGQCVTYGFEFDEENSTIKVSNHGAIIAKVPLKPFVDKLITLGKEKANDPNGASSYYTHEEMALTYQTKIKLKFYFDEIVVSNKAKNTVQSYKALVLFSP